MNSTTILLDVIDLNVTFPSRNKDASSFALKAVDSVSFKINKGETLGLVGESGCGKTTLGRTIIRLQKQDSGIIRLNNIDICTLTASKLRTTRKAMQMVFQNPYSSLNPRMTVLDIISEPLSLTKRVKTTEKIERVSSLMKQVGLDPSMSRKFPHEFSGGQRQRIAIARALAANPSLIIADEPVSSLDVSVQAQILTVLKTLRDEMNLTMLFISHDLSVVRYISHRVAVMFKGRIVETGTTNALFTKPQHPYTIALLAAVPEPDPDKRFYDQVHHTLIDTGATVSGGCAFRNRCPFSFEKCIHHKPELSPVSDTSTHLVACFRT